MSTRFSIRWKFLLSSFSILILSVLAITLWMAPRCGAIGVG